MLEVKGKRSCLLIVDDEPLNRELLRRVLHREYDIEEAEDANEAIEVLERRAGNTHLMLCDQQMPGRSGTQLAADVRRRWPEVRIILLTGYDDDPGVMAAVDRGDVDEVLAKPWRGRALKSCIAQRLGHLVGEG
jgi:two-component system, NtrC family, response regulator HupR/HoxA